jgi:hypothetical protein
MDMSKREGVVAVMDGKEVRSKDAAVSDFGKMTCALCAHMDHCNDWKSSDEPVCDYFDRRLL